MNFSREVKDVRTSQYLGSILCRICLFWGDACALYLSCHPGYMSVRLLHRHLNVCVYIRLSVFHLMGLHGSYTGHATEQLGGGICVSSFYMYSRVT